CRTRPAASSRSPSPRRSRPVRAGAPGPPARRSWASA
ncbi:MAG: Cell wall-binding protein, partial [uncultured Friedmanniella sp.]